MSLLDKIPALLKNKYFLTIIGFAVWMFWFDDRDIITTHFRHTRELKQLLQSKQYYQEQITKTRLELNELKQDESTKEKYAREKYFMKRDNEDLFVVKPVETK